MIIDCHFHVDETMLTLEQMIEGMDQNHVTKTALIAPMNETMFEVDSTIQHHVQNYSVPSSYMRLLSVSIFMMDWFVMGFSTLWTVIQNLY